METKKYNFRLTDSTIEDLDYLCGLYGMSRTAIISNLILADAEKHRGDPLLTDFLEKMRDMMASAEELSQNRLGLR